MSPENAKSVEVTERNKLCLPRNQQLRQVTNSCWSYESYKSYQNQNAQELLGIHRLSSGIGVTGRSRADDKSICESICANVWIQGVEAWLAGSWKQPRFKPWNSYDLK